MKYPKAFFIAGGDINDLKVSEILEISSAFRQIVTKPTRQGKILSVRWSVIMWGSKIGVMAAPCD